MGLTLHVDGDRWRAHLRATAAAHPGLVPVTKGNGYGFGLARLARRAAWLGADTIAVGTYEELPELAPHVPRTARPHREQRRPSFPCVQSSLPSQTAGAENARRARGGKAAAPRELVPAHPRASTTEFRPGGVNPHQRQNRAVRRA